MQDESRRPRPEQMPGHAVPPLGGVDPFSVTPVNAAPSNRGVFYILGAIVLALTFTALVFSGRDAGPSAPDQPGAAPEVPLAIDPPAPPPPMPPPLDQNSGQDIGGQNMDSGPNTGQPNTGQ